MENYGFDMPSKKQYYFLFVLNFIIFVLWCVFCYFDAKSILNTITLDNFYLFVIAITLFLFGFIGLFYWNYFCFSAYYEQYKTITFSAEDYEKLIDLLNNLYDFNTTNLTDEEFKALAILSKKLPNINNIFLLGFLSKYGD